MITITDVARSVLEASYEYHARAESWRAGVLLADNVPIADGTEFGDRSLAVPERVSVTVPRYDGTTDWSPVGEDHPLAAEGQRLVIWLGIGVPGNYGGIEWVRRGEYVIVESVADGDAVNVELRSLLHLIDEARLVSPFQPTGTLASALRALLQPALTVVFDSGLVDRAVTAGRMNFDEDRLAGVGEILDAWPAEAYVHPNGYLYVQPVVTPVNPDVDLFGLTIGAPSGESTRAGAANVIVARGTATDGGQVQGVAYDTTPTSPRRYGGPFNPLPVPEYLFSPLLTTVAQCTAAARTRLTRRLRAQTLPYKITLPPRPDLQMGDAFRTTESRLVQIEALTLPYTPGRAMELTVAEIAQ